MIAGPTEVLIIADATARPDARRRRPDRPGGARRGRRRLVRHHRRRRWPRRCRRRSRRRWRAAPRAAIARAALERNGLVVLVPVDARGDRGGQPAGAGASRDRGRGRRADRGRRSGTPGAIFLGDDTPEPVGDYIAGPEPRAAHQRHRAVRVAARRVRLRQAHQRDPVHRGPGWRPTPTRSSRWRRRRGCTGTRRRCGCGRRGGGRQADSGVRRRELTASTAAHDDQRLPRRLPAACAPRRRSRLLGWCSVLTGAFMVRRGGRAAGSAARSPCWPMPGTCSPTSARWRSALLTAWIAQRPADDTKTYGYLRWEILAALVNGAALFGIAGWVVVEAIQRIQHPEPIRTGLFLAVAAAGLVVNLVSLRPAPRLARGQPQHPRRLPPRDGRRARLGRGARRRR